MRGKARIYRRYNQNEKRILPTLPTLLKKDKNIYINREKLKQRVSVKKGNKGNVSTQSTSRPSIVALPIKKAKR